MQDLISKRLSNAGHLVEVQCEDSIRLNGFLQYKTPLNRHQSALANSAWGRG